MAVETRPLLIGACNPHSPDQRYALFPSPQGSSGWRLWNMLCDRKKVTRQDYAAAFDRRNLCPQIWRWDFARSQAQFITAHAAGRRIVLFGNDVAGAFFDERPPLIHPVEFAGAVWRFLPHPSGRCRWYNDRNNRLMAAMILEQLYEESTRV